MATVSIRDVTKRFNRTEVIHGVSLEIEAGAFVVILGPSGCGKSTLLRMIAGLEATTGGEIAIGGRVVNDLQPRERGCAMVFQNYALYPHMSVEENLGYALKVAGVGRAERRDRVVKVAEILGLGEFLDRKPGQLSGGQRQRVAMGRAIIREPKLFLFDEPLSNLDAKLRVQMRIEIRQLHQRLGATSLFVTHDQVEAMTLADRLVVMRDGIVEQVGTPTEVYHAPASTFVAGFLGSPPMNLLDGRWLDDGHTVQLEGGLRVKAPLPLRARAGMRATIGIRPERLRLVGHEGGTWAWEHGFVEELGAGHLVHGRVAGQELIVADFSGTPVGEGLERLAVDPADVHVFDPENGQRFPAAEAPARTEQASMPAAF